MTLFQIAFKNIQRDKHTYFSYYLSSTVTIMLFFLFMSAAMHPDLNQIQDGSTLSLALVTGNIIIYIFAFLFIGYSSWAFLGSRGKQLGIYTILGMSPKQMKKMLFGENMLIGMSAIISGLVCGILFSGLFFKLIRNIFVTISFDMYLPIFPILITFGLFTIMFLVIGLITPYFISHKKVLWFLKSDQSYAENTKVSYISIFCGILFLVGVIGLLIPGVGDSLGDLFMPAVLICVVGCVFFLTPQIGSVYSVVKMHSQRHFQGVHLFADSEASAAIKENSHMMSLNAVLLAMSFLAICALGSMQSNVVEDVENITPFAYMYVERPENIRVDDDIHLLDETLLGNINIKKVSYDILREEFTFGFLKESDFNNILLAKNKDIVKLKDNEILVLPGNKDTKNKNHEMNPSAEKYLDAFLQKTNIIKPHDQMVSTTGAFQEIYVIKDQLWEALKERGYRDLYVESYTGYEDANWIKHIENAEYLEEQLKQDDRNYDYTYAFTTLGNYYTTELLMRKLCTFVGVSVSLIFLVASVSMIYFRLYTTLEREKKKYLSMYKLGFSMKEMRKTIYLKVKALLWIPFIVAMIVMWSGILYMDTLISVSNVPMSLKYSFIFVVSYIIFYRIVVRVYQNKFDVN